jgi:triphosphatase
MALDNPSETELAFTLTDCAPIENHPLFVGVEATSGRLTSTYFDTPSRVLERSGWTVRVRSQGDRRIQTVKGPPVAVTRPEWNIDLDPSNRDIDLDRLKTTPVWPIIDSQASALAAVFETDLVRITRNVHFEDTHIETAIDEGLIRSLWGEPRTASIRDLELELKYGNVGAMFRLAIQLAIDTGIVMEAASKAERGYHLINGGAPQVHKYEDVALLKGTPTLFSFRHMLADVLSHLRQNLRAARAGQAGGIHQLRVGVRRTRALLCLFRPILHPATVRGFDGELRYFSTIFGQARDWDVFIIETLALAIKEMPKTGWLHLVRHVALEKQAESHAAVVRELDSNRFNSLILSLMGWSEDYSDTAPCRGYERPIEKVMPDLLNLVAASMDKRRRQMNGTPNSTHAFRKGMKKMRYAVEFAESLYPEKAVTKFLRPCRDIQDALGGLNDVEVTRHLIEVLTVSYPAVTPAIRELSLWLDTREHKTASRVPKLLRKLRDDRPFWV